MPVTIVASLSGLIFGFGLALSGMLDPAKIQGFLDVFGAWDPTLLLVLGGAVGCTLIAFPLVLQRPHPLFAERFHLPTRTELDAGLVAGSALFGVGWGLSGYCPGPALASLSAPNLPIGLFVAAMLIGSFAYDKFAVAQRRVYAVAASD